MSSALLAAVFVSFACAAPVEGTTPANLPSSVTVTREQDSAALHPSGQKYLVECRFVGEKLAFPLPTFTITDGEKVTMADLSRTRDVIGHREGRPRQPITREIVEGTTLQVTVIKAEGDSVVVDATFSAQGKPATGATGRRYTAQHLQLIECLKVGETAQSAPFQHTKDRFEITVKLAE